MMNNVNHDMIDAYLNGHTSADLPDTKALEADTNEVIGRTAAIKQTLALLSDNAKATTELDEAEAVLRRATGRSEVLEVVVPENVPMSNGMAPRVNPVLVGGFVAVFIVTMAVLIGVLIS